ncbi:uncharacterized protein J3D65DRAFT_325136 [Phyllosticta citribraziliensis]|uniref:Uncharacterized protein n=1 Tax=Phyllosticta citribraziliensis TaxID=989973 RepID=A0ABR1LUN6_9PEZI
MNRPGHDGFHPVEPVPRNPRTPQHKQPDQRPCSTIAVRNGRPALPHATSNAAARQSGCCIELALATPVADSNASRTVSVHPQHASSVSQPARSIWPWEKAKKTKRNHGARDIRQLVSSSSLSSSRLRHFCLLHSLPSPPPACAARSKPRNNNRPSSSLQFNARTYARVTVKFRVNILLVASPPWLHRQSRFEQSFSSSATRCDVCMSSATRPDAYTTPPPFSRDTCI